MTGIEPALSASGYPNLAVTLVAALARHAEEVGVRLSLEDPSGPSSDFDNVRDILNVVTTIL